jgi:hypothetical protein
MPLYRGRLLSNQDGPDIERKHGPKKWSSIRALENGLAFKWSSFSDDFCYF